MDQSPQQPSPQPLQQPPSSQESPVSVPPAKKFPLLVVLILILAITSILATLFLLNQKPSPANVYQQSSTTTPIPSGEPSPAISPTETIAQSEDGSPEKDIKALEEDLGQL